MEKIFSKNKKIAKEILKEVKVLVFGSIVRNQWTPTSDIDILIISPNLPEEIEERGEIRTKIKRKLDPFSPFHLHLATPKEFKGWYKKFIKKDYIWI